jgi:hypothetical protein
VKVRVTFTVDIDADAWSREYGTDVPAVIRADVKTYAEQAIHAHLSCMGLLTDTDQTPATRSTR